ncbi:MAG: hypothetical protein RRB22_04375 [Gammaproteobacteria bacterium]|nr:hypothetical protein [Gammaproteobacteria bacterium]
MLLRKFGYGLENPHGNRIDVVKYEETFVLSRVFGRAKTKTRRVAQIGFPGWKKQVGKGAISTVRNAASLTQKNGNIDSKTFFHGADPMESLIDRYHEPLLRLAYR